MQARFPGRQAKRHDCILATLHKCILATLAVHKQRGMTGFRVQLRAECRAYSTLAPCATECRVQSNQGCTVQNTECRVQSFPGCRVQINVGYRVQSNVGYRVQSNVGCRVQSNVGYRVQSAGS